MADPGTLFSYAIPAESSPVTSLEMRNQLTALAQNHFTTDPNVPSNPRRGQFRILDDPAVVPQNVRLQWYDGTIWRTLLEHLEDVAAGIVFRSGGGLKFIAGELAVEPADFAGAGLEDDGTDNLRIAASAAGDGLQGGGGSALSVDAGDGLQIGGGVGGATALNIDVSDFAGTGLEDDASENLRIAAAAAGNGLTGGGGSALSVDPDSTTGGDILPVNVVANGVGLDQSTVVSPGARQNGAGINIKSAQELLSALSGSSVSTTNLIPAGVKLLFVTCRVTTTITGATTFDVGDADVNRWGAGIALSAGTTVDHTDATADPAGAWSAATRDVTLTANGSVFTGGAVRVTAHYIDVTAPTS